MCVADVVKSGVNSGTAEDGPIIQVFPASRLAIRETTSHKDPVCCPNNPVDQLNCFQTSVPTAHPSLPPPLPHIWLGRPAFQPQPPEETPIVPDAALHHGRSLLRPRGREKKTLTGRRHRRPDHGRVSTVCLCRVCGANGCGSLLTRHRVCL